jgi:hypothetical protein
LLELNDVTLLAVTSVRVPDALWALKRSCRGIRFAGVKLLTDLDLRSSFAEVVKIPRLDYDGYSRFMVYELHKHFPTSHALVIQDDGYVVSPPSWRAEFLEYDYIGAPWPFPSDDFTYRDPSGRLRRVGNGGFSLRSRRLCALASDLALPWDPFHGFYNEDGFICVNRVLDYEGRGCKIAPLEIAKYFSHESDLPELKGIVPFGFHGKESRYNVKYCRRQRFSARFLARKIIRAFGGTEQ